MSRFKDPAAAVAWLRSPQAIRSRCDEIFKAACKQALDHFILDLNRLDDTTRYVIETMRANYPDLSIPYHSRWRHFAGGGIDRWSRLAATLTHLPPREIGRIRVELALTSVLLDAGAGQRWVYQDPDNGFHYRRSEGLAVASFALYRQGAYSSDPSQPLKADADALLHISQDTLARAFQVTTANPLVGLDGRVQLLRRLGAVVRDNPSLFGASRLGCLFDALLDQAQDRQLPAVAILTTVLQGLSAIWPGRISLGGVNLGDVWRHPLIRSADLTDGLIPFHKLSQWLSYSLVEPLEEAGVKVTELDELTGLPEYRNGGLFIDTGVLKPRHAEILTQRHQVDSPVIVEWRALTVALLDRLAERARQQLQLDREILPLARILQGGSWSAGRRIAREQRPDGSPPIRLDSDGTVF